MKRIISITTALLLVFALFAGCSQQTQSTENTASTNTGSSQTPATSVVSGAEADDSMFTDRDKEIGYSESESTLITLADGAVNVDGEGAKIDGNTVTVEIGSVPHPMTEEHYIDWVYLMTARGGQRKSFKPGDKPVLKFALTGDDEPLTAFAYCNLHGLWMTEI